MAVGIQNDSELQIERTCFMCLVHGYEANITDNTDVHHISSALILADYMSCFLHVLTIDNCFDL